MAQVNVNLAFSADTGKAKTQIMELQSLLSKIAYTGATGGTDKLQTDLHAASEAAKELQFHLNNAFNVSTGNFDLSMLDRSLKTSGSNITDLSVKLLSAGATGQQAFVKLAQSISLADQPMFRISNRMKEFAVTMKNTVKWQLSSSMLHGFMGAVQSAYGYAQDLNESLNNIRIVTGYNIDKMAQFAEQANKAAKALSTTTTDYTDASLIYFQQGLSDAEVQGRTDTTIKLANVTGQSVEETANQMTAIWNNFDDGSKSLDYYADVITALGAATASSSKEISEGLNKFSAIAESVGLSYEYASAALATVTATTRQSADVVGNSFKTLFARIQGLNLGETLDDGTTLNKYSEALFKVGINVKDQSGQLKDMNTILDEMGSKWNTLGKDQQVALAQTVGGVRQYTQLIALMDNWDYFQQNLGVATGAEGTLNKQADIYAESWEAAEKRVKAAAEGIFQSLLDDKFFISINNGFANVLNGLNAFIKGAGGVKTVLVGLAGIVGTVFANQIPDALDTFKYNFEIATKGTHVAYDRIQSQMTKATQDQFNEYITSKGKSGINKDSAMGFAIEQANQLTAAKNKLALVSDKMSASEKQYADTVLKDIQMRQDEIFSIKQKNEALKESIQLQKESLKKSNKESLNSMFTKESIKSEEDFGAVRKDYFSTYLEYKDKFKLLDAKEEGITNKDLENIGIYEEFRDQYAALVEETDNFNEHYNNMTKDIQEMTSSLGENVLSKWLTGDLSEAKSEIINFGESTNKTINQIQSLLDRTDIDDNLKFDAAIKEIEALKGKIPSAIQQVTGLDKVFHNLTKKSANFNELKENFKQLSPAIENCKIEVKDFEKFLTLINGKSVGTLATDMKVLESNETTVVEKTQALQNLLNNFNPGHIIRMSEAFSGLIGFLGSAVTVGNSVISIFNSLGNPDLSFWEKFSSIIMGITTITPMAKSAFEGLNTAISGGNQILAAMNLLLGAQAGAFGDNAIAINKQTAAEIANEIAIKKAKGTKEEDIIATVTAKLMTQGLSKADAQAAAAKMVHAGATEFLTGALAKLGVVLAWIKSHLLLTIGIAVAVVAAIAGIAWIIDKLHTSQKEANEAITEANSKYDEEKQKLDELKGSLKSVQDQIKKLQSQDSLSLVEQEELDKLLEQEASLQRQVVLQEQLAQAAKQKSADTFEGNVSKASKWINNTPDNRKTVTLFDKNLYGKVFTPEQFLAEINKLYTDEEGNILEGFKDKYAKAYKYYENWVNDYNSKQAEWVNANKDSFNEVTEGYQNWFDIYGNKEGYEQQVLEYANLISNMNKAIYGEQYNDKVLVSMDKTFEASSDTKDKNITNTILNDLSDGVEPSAAEIAVGFSNSFKNSLLKQGILPENYAQHLIDEYSHVAKALEGTGITLNDLLANGMNLEDFDILAQIKITGEDDLNSIIEKIEAYKNNSIEVGFNLQNFKNNYSFAQGVKDGETYSADDIAGLDAAYQAYFQEQLDGSYQLKISASEFKEIVESIELDKLKEEIQNQRKTLSAAGEMTEEEFISYQTGQASNQQLVEAMGGIWSETDQEANIEATQAAAAAYSNLAASLIANSEAASLTAENTAELDALLNSGMISLEDYNARLAEMRNILDEDIDAEQYENLTEILQSMAEASDDNREGAQEFSEDLKDNKEAAQEVAKAILRYDSAVEDVKKNSKDWMKILKSGNLQDMADIMDDLTNSYKDMLDLDGDVLSDDFVTNTENLELMQKAAEGSEEAYNELAKRASEDIIAQCKLEADFDQTKFDAALAAFQAECAALNLPDLEVGANLDYGNFLQACTDLVNAAGMTADQATSYLASMGVDAEVEQETETKQDVVATSLTPNTYLRIQPYTVPAADGSPQTAYASFPVVSYTQSPVYGTKETTATALRVKSANKSSGGGIKHANSSNGSGSKSNSSGGGGGGGGSAPKHAEKKNDSDKERYHTLNNQLEDLKSEYDAISEAADRAFGKEKLKAIDDEINKTDELINKQEEYLDAIKENLPIDKAVMDAYYTDLIGGIIEYDERGNISNYDQIQDAMFAKYNQMTSLDEDSEEWQVFEKKYEQLEKYIEQYEETYDLLRDEEAEYQDLLRQRIDLQLEKVQYSIEIQLEIPENEIATIEYQLGKIEDDAFKSAEAIGLLSKKAENIYDQIQVNKQGLNDLLELSLSTQEIIQLMNGDMSILEGKTFTEDQIDAIKEYRDNLLDLNEKFDDIRENIEEQVMEVFDAWNEKLEQGIDKLDHYGDVLESYKNIIDIVGKDTLGLSDTFMATLNQSSIDNAINKIIATKKSYEAMIDTQSQAEQALEEAKARNDEASIKMWEENLQSITEEAQSAREEMLSAWEDALDGIAEQFEATVERVVDIFNKEIYTLGGLEGLSEDFSRQQENADIMLDDYQKIYELSKLSRDINKSIDDTDSISGKQKLKKLLEQINKLQEDGVEMSQYDLEYMQKTYDLRMAEIELEEAQRAKNTVRLRKDNEGNWSYVYTQNMDAVDTAQQKYEDALYAMQDVSSNYIDEMSEKLISTSQEMEEALAAIRIQDYANIDDYYAEVQRVQKQYEDELVVQQKELQKAIDNNKILYDEDWTNYHNATGYKISDTQNFATTFRDTLLGSLMGSEEDTANFTDVVNSAVNTLTQGLMQGAEVYYANLQNAMNAAGTSTDDFAKDFEEKIKEIEEKSEESTNKIKDLAKDMSSSLKDITDSITTWQETYGEVMQQIINSNLDVINSFNNMLEALSIDTNSITVKYDILSDNKKEPEQYASGGYTGKWGNYGKLAILDEKELILNKDDTVNFLDALGIAKQIIDTIDLNALQASYGFGNLVPATINENNSQTIEQDVHITAEFPNATDHNEIEQAFETLINKASQYANRK